VKRSDTLCDSLTFAIFTNFSQSVPVATTNHEIGARVKSLLEDHGVPRHEVSELLDIDPSGLSRALNGERMFKAREIALIAERLGISTSVILEGAPSGSSNMAVAARRSTNDRTTIERAMERVELFTSLAEIADSKSVPDFGWISVPTDGPAWRQGQELADQVLRRAGLDSEPLPRLMHELAALLEQRIGIQVSLEALGPGLDGLSICNDRFKLAMVSTSTAPARQRWTLAHEIAHLVLNDTQNLLVDETVWNKTPQETRANAFAAAFLMPADLLRDAWGAARAPDEDLVGRLLDTFHVSLDALAFRLHNVGLINAEGRDRVRAMRPMVSLMRNQASPQAEGMWLPTTLSRDAILAFNEGRLGVRWIAALCELDPEVLLDRIYADSEEAAALDAVDAGSSVA
jgi:Zn-dependent peptidase ImmA (M78 family)/transcriptional regulator with XRE-family HTH domain